jgi:putative transposase
LLASLKYCQANKELDIFNYVFMLNHIHLIVRSNDMAGFIRDFKTFTSKQLKKNITETEQHILKLFDLNGEYHFWQKNNMPEVVTNEDFYLVKAKYIENNPVRKNYVREARHWVYSSANIETNLLELISIFD